MNKPGPDVLTEPPDPRAGVGIGCGVRLQSITFSYDSTPVLRNISLEIEAGEFFALLGPSGCGKTSLLRVIAGLEQPEAGSVFLGNMEVTNMPAHLRPVNTVFQSYALFPHLTVFENVAFGLRMRKTPRAEIEARCGRILELTRLEELKARRPAELSGGQKQRVALARALVNEPKVLLLDEPLSAVDQKFRQELRGELKSLQRQLGATFIYVTHDLEEALSMSDRVAVMNQGQVEQISPPRELYEQPLTQFTAEFLGDYNVITGAVLGLEAGRARIRCDFGELEINGSEAWFPGARIALALRKDFIVQRENTAGASSNTFAAIVEAITYRGAEKELHLRVGPASLKMSLPAEKAGGLEPGAQITIHLPSEKLRTLRAAAV